MSWCVLVYFLDGNRVSGRCHWMGTGGNGFIANVYRSAVLPRVQVQGPGMDSVIPF